MKTNNTSSPTSRSRTIPVPFLAVVAVSLLAVVTPARSQIDNINGGAAPANYVWSGTTSNGWNYTPAFSYTLTGISSYFQPVTDGGGDETVTVDVLTGNGGTVLDSETFSVNSYNGGLQGATLAEPLSLTSGTTYFIDLQGIGGLGVEVGQWNDSGPGGTSAPSNGATVNLGDWYYANANTTTLTEEDPTHTGSYSSGAGGNVSFDEPILDFYGTAAPEPTTSALLGVALLGFSLRRRARREADPPHSPTPIPALTVHGAAGAKAISWQQFIKPNKQISGFPFAVPRGAGAGSPLPSSAWCGRGQLQSATPMNKTSHPGPLARELSTLSALLLATAFWSLPGRAHAQAPQYTVTILTGLGGSNGSSADGINASGQVAGASYTTGNAVQDAVVWNGTTPTALTGLGGSNGSAANAINTSGQVAGASYTTGNAVQDAVVWNGTTPTVLAGEGGMYTQANGINASGQVAGHSEISGGAATDAVVWNGMTPTVLTGIGGTQSYANAINASGQVVGQSLTSGNAAFDAVVWNGTTPTILTGEGGTGSQAIGINASGQAVGYSETSGNATSDAVVWNGTTPTILGNLGGSEGSVASSINASGEVVGNSFTTGNASFDGFLYTGGTMYDLNSIVVPGSGVTGIGVAETGDSINDLGQIAATGVYDGEQVAVLLTPTPEPSSALLLLGSGAMLLLRRRRAAV